MHEQSISNCKSEAITQGMTQNINREIPFYPDPIIGLLLSQKKIYDCQE